MNWRGRYEGGGHVFTAKHWWSPTERKAARLAALIAAAEPGGVRAVVERELPLLRFKDRP